MMPPPRYPPQHPPRAELWATVRARTSSWVRIGETMRQYMSPTETEVKRDCSSRGPGASRKPPMGTVAPRDSARRAQNAIGRLPEPSEASRF